MKAMILAAGRGERMRPLTDSHPKPLLQVKGQALISYHLKALACAGINEVVINHAWLGEQIIDYCGDGSRFGLAIHYSRETEALETAGGIHKALPMLGDSAFLVVNADILTDFDYAALVNMNPVAAHLVLVPNPEHHPQGDFSVADGRLVNDAPQKFTYSGIGVYQPELFLNLPQEKYPLAPILRDNIPHGNITAEVYFGEWIDIGTPERLQQINQG